jgi:hypothetical protein
MFVANVLLAEVRGYPLWDASMPFVFAAFGIQTLLGFGLRKVRAGAFWAAGSGAVIFYALSNLGVFLVGGLYPRTPHGLVACYVAALPFLKSTLLGDLLWTLLLTPVYRWASRHPPRSMLQTA